MKKLLSIILFISFNLIIPFTSAEPKTVLREYPIPEHGLLLLEVIETWNVTYYEPTDIATPIIIFYPSEKPHNFQLTLSPLWDDGVERDVSDIKFIKQYLEETGTEILSYSDQTQLQLFELIGRSGQGYYFQLSDSNAREGEFKYLTQGALAVGEILLIFSYFSNQPEDETQRQVLEMIQGAIQQNQRNVHFME